MMDYQQDENAAGLGKLSSPVLPTDLFIVSRDGAIILSCQASQLLAFFGIGPDAEPILASESLAAGALVNIWNNGGVRSIRNADASASAGGKAAHGFVLAAASSGQNPLVYYSGAIAGPGISGLTPGTLIFLSDATPGRASPEPVTISGHLLQCVGIASAPGSIRFFPAPGLLRS